MFFSVILIMMIGGTASAVLAIMGFGFGLVGGLIAFYAGGMMTPWLYVLVVKDTVKLPH
jgi:hypothetical protein